MTGVHVRSVGALVMVQPAGEGAVLVLTRLMTLLSQLALPTIPTSFFARLFRRELESGVSMCCGEVCGG